MIVCGFSLLAENPLAAYMPEIHGAFRTRWEMEPNSGENRFQVRNARLTVSGKIAPPISYFLQTDLCDQGKIKILDAYGKIYLSDKVAVQAGQFRMPFGLETFRAPLNYVFSNRSFIGKQVCNVRAVGAKLMYEPVKSLLVEGGVFNPTAMADHNVWVKTMAYAGKATYSFGDFKIEGGIQSLEPDSVRINLLDAALCWMPGRWTFHGEYMNKHYTNSAHKTAHAYVFWTEYKMPVTIGVFNQLSVEGRFDGMTAHSSGKRNSLGKLYTSDEPRNRITAGTTLSYIYKNLHCDVRLNYEKYFYHHGASIARGEDDKISAELVIRF